MSMKRTIRIGTRESQLAVWQATQVKEKLAALDVPSELVYIKSEGDIDLSTPLYEMGVQGIFTRSLDIALLTDRIDIAVHSMKDVPTQLPKGIAQAAVLARGPIYDLLVFKHSTDFLFDITRTGHIATSSIRRTSQWLNRYPGHQVHNLRGNVNTRLRKLSEETWDGAIFAQAGLERINLRPENSVVLDWMLPAPAQGAIVIVARQSDEDTMDTLNKLNDEPTSLCTKIERDFLRELYGGCSTPISALARINNGQVHFAGNILSIDGQEKIDITKNAEISNSKNLGKEAALELLSAGGKKIADSIRNAK